ncbi:superkiller protein 3 [Aquimarina sp. MAR_2010_214]|uniref:tetratricopeptide repeat protein n=1 Tax=Aquimarina sp. MAR_2010_214 TaxID=1250026 RepID=UPI000C715865|nr:tetratricopeptide repeat protein [Aquimarina sp. MAR_2010_214]PKV49793.1 superkiller protein 3 [Aquimarina sp. MAR_2010_214]
MQEKKATKKRIHTLLEYMIFLVIPLTIFFVITIKNKNKIEEATSNNSTTIIDQKNLAQENKLINKAIECINQKKYKESIDINLEVLSLNPNNKYAYNNIGFAYGSLKQWDIGIEYCSKAIELDPNFKLAKNNLNWMKSKK